MVAKWVAFTRRADCSFHGKMAVDAAISPSVGRGSRREQQSAGMISLRDYHHGSNAQKMASRRRSICTMDFVRHPSTSIPHRQAPTTLRHETQTRPILDLPYLSVPMSFKEWHFVSPCCLVVMCESGCWWLWLANFDLGKRMSEGGPITEGQFKNHTFL